MLTALARSSPAELTISALSLALLVPVKELNVRFRDRLPTPIPGEVVMVRAILGPCPLLCPHLSGQQDLEATAPSWNTQTLHKHDVLLTLGLSKSLPDQLTHQNCSPILFLSPGRAGSGPLCTSTSFPFHFLCSPHRPLALIHCLSLSLPTQITLFLCK